MSKEKNKRKKLKAPSGRGRVVVLGGDPKMSEVTQALDMVEERRKKLFPNLRRFVVDYDLQVSEGKVALNVLSESMSAPRAEQKSARKRK